MSKLALRITQRVHDVQTAEKEFLKTKKALLRAVGYENSAFDEIESITTVSTKPKMAELHRDFKKFSVYKRLAYSSCCYDYYNLIIYIKPE